MQQEKSKFELLRDKRILSILNGDTDFGLLKVNGEDSDITISMPYLSGPTLCDISREFGLNVAYGWNGGAQSRWAYLDDLLAFCIQNKQESQLLSFLFSRGQFVNKLNGQTPDIIEYAYTQIIDIVIKQINGVLYFGGNELIHTGNTFFVREIGKSVNVITPSIQIIDREYIAGFI